jgi:hypothetical protein
MVSATAEAAPDCMAMLITGQSCWMLLTDPAVVLQIAHHSAQK